MNDDDFLRSFAERAVPDVPVHTERVIPRAHRRRRIIRTAQTVGVIAVLGVVAGGIGWAWQDAPNPIATPSPTVSPTPTPTVEPTPDPEPSTEAPAPPVETETPAVALDEVTGALPYWHIRVTRPDSDLVYETWTAIDLNGVAIADQDPATAGGVYPVGTLLGLMFATDGPWPETAEEFQRAVGGAEPTDSMHPDDVYAERAMDVLFFGGAAPRELRAVAYELLLDSPLVTTAPGTDIDGRPGDVLEVALSWGTYRLVVDPGTLLILQQENPIEDGAITLSTHEAVTGPPVTPPEPERALGD